MLCSILIDLGDKRTATINPHSGIEVSDGHLYPKEVSFLAELYQLTRRSDFIHHFKKDKEDTTRVIAYEFLASEIVKLRDEWMKQLPKAMQGSEEEQGVHSFVDFCISENRK